MDLAQEATEDLEMDRPIGFWTKFWKVLGDIFWPLKGAAALDLQRTSRSVDIGPFVPNTHYALNATEALLIYQNTPEVRYSPYTTDGNIGFSQGQKEIYSARRAGRLIIGFLQVGLKFYALAS